jgi:peptidoglycan-associated lipoprotein
MKLLSKKLTLAVASALVLFATGCAKKPKRPDPSSTVMGPEAGGGLGGGGAGDMGLTDPSAAGLSARPDGVIETEDKIIGLLQPVYFDFADSAVKASERPKLQAAKDYLDKNPQHRLLLEGYCDWRGTAEYNLSLGDRRAAAAKTYVQSLGVAPAKTETLSKGDLDAKENGTDEEMSKDRRVELVILKK